MKLIKALGLKSGAPTPVVGQYLKFFDFEAREGRGVGSFTPNISEAKMFPNKFCAFAFWRTQSRTFPYRLDGKPNQPLTAVKIEIVDVVDVVNSINNRKDVA